MRFALNNAIYSKRCAFVFSLCMLCSLIFIRSNYDSSLSIGTDTPLWLQSVCCVCPKWKNENKKKRRPLSNKRFKNIHITQYICGMSHDNMEWSTHDHNFNFSTQWIVQSLGKWNKPKECHECHDFVLILDQFFISRSKWIAFFHPFFILPFVWLI